MRPKPRIMVIDDSPLVLQTVRAVLDEEGYEVITRDQPIGSGAAILRARPDLVLLDLSMPALRGDEVVKLVRHHDSMSHVPILLLSSEPEPELREITERCGADGYLLKDGQFENLLDRIRPWLEHARGGRDAPETPSNAASFNRTLPCSLFVDDEPEALRAYQRILPGTVRGEYVSSARQALARVESPSPPDVIVSDVVMPGMTGIDLYERAVAVDGSWKERFVLVTGASFAGNDINRLRRSSARLLTKPFDPEELLGIIAGMTKRAA